MITVAKKRRPKSKNYFTKDTENAIVRYNNESDFLDCRRTRINT